MFGRIEKINTGKDTVEIAKEPCKGNAKFRKESAIFAYFKKKRERERPHTHDRVVGAEFFFLFFFFNMHTCNLTTFLINQEYLINLKL